MLCRAIPGRASPCARPPHGAALPLDCGPPMQETYGCTAVAHSLFLQALDDCVSRVVLFPGQGSQYIGMCARMASVPLVRDMFQTADRILGFDLLTVCLEGPEELLEQTICNQCAVFVGALAAIELTRSCDPELLEDVQGFAGFSLGELSALVHAGCLSFEDGLRLVKVRANAMMEQIEKDSKPQGMLSIIGLCRSSVELLCTQTANNSGLLCQIANELFDDGFVCAGHKVALEALSAAAVEAGARQVKPVRAMGAFHTDAMRGAAPTVRAMLLELRLSGRLRLPRAAVWSNVTGRPYPMESLEGFCEALLVLLPEQLHSPVLWKSLVKNLISSVPDDCVIVDCGPGKQLRTMVQRIQPDAGARLVHITV